MKFVLEGKADFPIARRASWAARRSVNSVSPPTGSSTDLMVPKSNFRTSPNNGHHQTIPAYLKR
jgi:hypothetical protein